MLAGGEYGVWLSSGIFLLGLADSRGSVVLGQPERRWDV